MILDTLLLPLLLTTMQMGAASADSYTTELCFSEADRIGLHIYEQNPVYTAPFGQRPSMNQFIISDIISITAMYGIGWLIRKTPARNWWWIPQAALIGAQVWQSQSNWKLYQRMRQ
jgi:hypothetical protein